jgi:hypothetical protein
MTYIRVIIIAERGNVMKRISIRKLIAGFLAVILIIAAAVPTRADDYLEGEPDEIDTGMVLPEMWELKDEGQCGDNVFYKFDNKTGVVRIYGTGETWDYDSMWGPNIWSKIFQVNGDVFTLKIDSGITEIKSTFIPESGTLVNTILPKSLKKIGPYNFWYSNLPEYLFYEGTLNDWVKVTIDSGNNFDGVKILFQGKWFTDVTEGKKFFFKPVYWAIDRGITKGHGPGTFQPYEACTRAMIVTFLWNYAGQPKVPGTTAFSDVKPTDWFYQAVSWAVKNGITSGYGSGTFKPNETCTRAMIVTFLKNYLAKNIKVQYQPLFPDVKKSDWFSPAVIWAYENGITSGKGGYFKPNDPCTRGEAVSFLYNVEKAK